MACGWSPAGVKSEAMRKGVPAGTAGALVGSVLRAGLDMPSLYALRPARYQGPTPPRPEACCHLPVSSGGAASQQRREEQQGGAHADREKSDQAEARQEAPERAPLGQRLVARDQRRVKQHSRYKVPSGIPSPRLTPPVAVAVSAAFPSGASDGMSSAVTA